MKSDYDSTSTKALKPPIEVKHSQVQFAIFGYQNRKSAISVKSDNAPLELLGSYPLEEIEASPQSKVEFLWELIDFSSKPIHWAISLPFRSESEGRGSEQLVLVWQGMATNSDKVNIKKIFDRNAVDIAESTIGEDHWRAVISVSPVIAECWRAEHNNRRLRAILWACAAIIVALVVSMIRV